MERNSDISRHSVYLSYEWSREFSTFHFQTLLILQYKIYIFCIFTIKRESISFKWNVKVENYFLTRDSCWEYNFLFAFCSFLSFVCLFSVCQRNYSKLFHSSSWRELETSAAAGCGISFFILAFSLSFFFLLLDFSSSNKLQETKLNFSLYKKLRILIS